jgi:nitrite reductase (NADH) large subunit
VDRDVVAANVLRVCEPGRTPLFVVVIGRFEIGRGGSGLLLADPEISRRHLIVESVGGAVVVSDLGSTNGTTVDGVRLTVPRVLGAGDVLRFGHCTLELSSLPVAGAGSGRILGAGPSRLGRLADRWTVGGHPIRSWFVLGVSGGAAAPSQGTHGRGRG